MGAPAELDERVRSLLTASIAEKVRWILADSWVHTSVTVTAFQWMEYLFKSGPSIRPMCMQLSADGGMGKTAILLAFLAMHPVQQTEDPLRLSRPVLFAECKPDPGGAAGVRHAILRAAWPEAKYFQLSEVEVDATLRAQGTKLILLDEFGEFTKSGAAHHKHALSELKRIGNTSRVNFAAATVSNLSHVLDVDQQFASRFRRKIQIPPWSLSQDLRDFAYGLERQLPFPERSNLDGDRLLPWLAQNGEGNTKEIVDLVRLGALHALGKNATHIDLTHLQAAKTDPLPPTVVLEN